MKNILTGFSCVILFTITSIAQEAGSTQATNNNTKSKTVMNNESYTTTVLVDQSPEHVFNAVNNPRAWWSEDIEGVTDKLNGEFLHHYKDVHVAKMKIVELIPGKKVVWQVLDNHFNFTKDTTEWKGTKIIFEIEKKGHQAQLTFTHLGLVPAYECYDICTDAWGNYIKGSLTDLITKGKGKPNPKEGGFNNEILEKYKLKN
jgi:hypothetical protein